MKKKPIDQVAAQRRVELWALPETDDCIYRGTLHKTGYVQTNIGMAHRIVYTAAHGDPGDLDIDHLCRNRACLNIRHLEAVTRLENVRRGLKGILTTHCPQGHLLEGDNLVPSSLPHRKCRTCHEARVAYNSRMTSMAQQKLGLTDAEYRQRYGRSVKVAEKIVSG